MIVYFGIALLAVPVLASPPKLILGDFLTYRVLKRSQTPRSSPIVCEQRMTVTAVSAAQDLLHLTTTEQCGFDSPTQTIARDQVSYSRALEINAEILQECERSIGGTLSTVASPLGNTSVCIVSDSTDHLQVYATPEVPITGFIQSLGVREDGEIHDYYLVEARLGGKTIGPATRR